MLSTIVSRATQLAGMDGGAIYEYDETREEFYLHTTDRLPDELVDGAPGRADPKGRGRARTAGGDRRAGRRSATSWTSAATRAGVREILIRLGYRSLLAVPLLREDHLLGGLVVNRKKPRRIRRRR